MIPIHFSETYKKIFSITTFFVITNLIFTVILDNSELVQAESYTEINGIISINTTWTKLKSPYIMKGNVLIDENATLTIEPGVDVFLDNYYYLMIKGQLNASGTKKDMISFSSTNNTPYNFDWSGIKIINPKNNSIQIIKYCIIKRAQFGIEIEFEKYMNNRIIDIQNNIIEDFGDYGIGFLEYNMETNGTSNKITINNNVFNNGYNAIDLTGIHTDIIIRNNSISNLFSGIGISGFKESDCIIQYNKIFLNDIGLGIRGESFATIKNNALMFNDIGLLISDIEGKPKIENNFIKTNDKGIEFRWGKSIWDTPSIFPIRNNSIIESNEYDIFLSNYKFDVNVSNNWWNTTNSSLIDERIYDYYDDFILGNVVYQPILLKDVFTIKNNAPIILNASIIPSHPDSNDLLNVSYTSYDPDDDVIILKEIKWYKNDIYQSQYDNVESIDNRDTTIGESWNFKIRISDGIIFSEEFESFNVTIKSKDSGEPNDTTDNNNDSDGDGYKDQEELNAGSDPENPKSTPYDIDGDGVSNDNDYYPNDPNRWKKEESYNFLLITIFITIVLILSIGYLAYTKINKMNILNHDTRSKIYDFVCSNPGEHFSGISKKLGINESTLRHHLKSLQTVERIKVKQVGKYNYYYPFDYNDSITLTPIQKEIVNKIRNEDGITTLSLATFLDKERQTIQYHIHDLTEKGIIKSDKKGNKLYWYINDESLSELKS